MTDEEIHKAGAHARTLGRSIHDNPFFASDMVPRVTRVSLADWNWKCQLWEMGWKMEDAFRQYDQPVDADLTD